MRTCEMLRLCAAIAACAELVVFDALAQGYPVKPIRLVVGYPPGGGTDVTARVVAQKVSENLGQTMLVENRPGANGAIAAERVAVSPADGYTLLLMSSNDAVLPALRAKLPFDLERDFAPVSLLTIGPMVLAVHPSVPARNIKELISLARSQPGKLSFASSGVGGTPHLAGELFNLMAKVRLVHVPYKGGADAVVATASGQVDMSFASVTSALPLIKVGKLKALAVTSATRVSSAPSIPTVNESGLPGYDRSSWYGIAAPAAVPKDIIARLNAEIGKAVNTPEMKESLNKQGLEPQTNTSEQFVALVHKEIADSARLIKLTGAKAE